MQKKTRTVLYILQHKPTQLCKKCIPSVKTKSMFLTLPITYEFI